MINFKKEIEECDMRISVIQEELSKCNLEISRLMKKENLKHLKKIK